MRLKLVCIILIGLLVIVETIARYYGLHEYPLFRSDKNYEYIHVANQSAKIYRNNFATNSYSMRSEEPAETDSLVFLLLGDSIINGGNQTDQDSLASTLLQKLLSKKYQHSKVFNISSYTWGPSNIFEYLKKNGSFKAKYVIIVHNGGDAFDYMTFNDSENLGAENGKPIHNYTLATVKLLETIYLRFVKEKLFPQEISKEIDKPKIIDQGFENIYQFCKKQHLPLVVYLHADKDEFSKSKYGIESRHIIDFYKQKRIPIIYDLTDKLKPEMYLDNIHFNSAGQKYMYNLIKENVLDTLEAK